MAQLTSTEISGSLTVLNDITVFGVLYATVPSASVATSASIALLANSASTSVSASHSLTSNTSISSSYAANVPATASYAQAAATAISSSHALVSDTSVSASHAVASDTTISASHALASDTSISSAFATTSDTSTSASYAPVETEYSASVSAQIGAKQDALVVGSTYQITASAAVSASTADAANTAISSAFATNAQDAVSASYVASADTCVSASHAVIADSSLTALTATSASYSDAALSASYSVSSSNALRANTASIATAISFEPTTASFARKAGTAGTATSSVSASYAPVEPNYSASVVVQLGTKQDTLVVGQTYEITASSAVSASAAPVDAIYSASVASILDSKQDDLVTGATYTVTASFAVSASSAPVDAAYSASVSTIIDTKQNIITSGSTYNITVSTASFWDSSSVVASIATKQDVITSGSTFHITADTASFWNSSSVVSAINAKQNIITSGSSFNITSSVAVTASHANHTLYSEYTLDPSGFPNRTDSVIKFDDSTRTFSIYPEATKGYYEVFSKGIKYTYNTTQSMPLPSTSGSAWYIFYDKTTMQLNTSSVEWLFGTGDIPIAVSYWDGARSTTSDERHGMGMDADTHRYLHDTMGPRYASGLTGVFTGSAGRFNIESGHWFDDDLDNGPTASISTLRPAYYSGSMIVFASTSSFYNGQAVWNNATTGATSSYTAGTYAAWWIYAVNGITNHFVAIMPQRTDTTLANARANAVPESLVFGNFPYKEAKLLYRVIINGNGVWQDTTDYRSAQYAGSTFTPTAHSALSGLSNDDHAQYLLLAGRSGGQTVTGGITASLQGSASYAENAGTASFLTRNRTYEVTASVAVSASYAPFVPTDVSAYLSASTFTAYMSGSGNQFAGTSSFAVTASYAANSMASLTYSDILTTQIFS